MCLVTYSGYLKSPNFKMRQGSISKAPPYGVDLLYFCFMGFGEPEVADYMRFTLLF
jgi:hypothetical protein